MSNVNNEKKKKKFEQLYFLSCVLYYFSCKIYK